MNHDYDRYSRKPRPRRHETMPLCWYWWRWVCQVARLADGLIGTVTLGFYCPDWQLWAERRFLNIMF